MTETVFWKGIYFAPANFTEKQGNSSLENADIVYAFEGIKALKKVPYLLNVTIRDGASGLLVKELENHLAIVGTTFSRSLFDGINIESSGGHVVIEITTVQNARFGYGLVYNRILDVMDLCSIVPDNASLPFVLKATGNTSTVHCNKVRMEDKSRSQENAIRAQFHCLRQHGQARIQDFEMGGGDFLHLNQRNQRNQIYIFFISISEG